MQLTRYRTRGGVTVQREVWHGPYEREHDTLARILDSRRGVLFSSSFEFPGRYTRWDMGFVDPGMGVGIYADTLVRSRYGLVLSPAKDPG